jgi:multiple sugar transport system ATP-binding protein
MGSPAMNIKTVPLGPTGATIGDVTLPLTPEQRAAAQEGGSDLVTIGFRPEDCDLVGAGDGGFPVVVDLVEELGSDAFVHGHSGGDGARETFVVRIAPRNSPRLTDTVYVRPRADRHHAFHAVNGVRL